MGATLGFRLFIVVASLVAEPGLQSVLGLPCYAGFSLVAATGSYSLVAVCGFLIAVASLVVEQGLWGTQASAVAALGLQSTGSRHAGFSSCGPWALELGFSSCGVQA